jgi:voltage-gated potassium channel
MNTDEGVGTKKVKEEKEEKEVNRKLSFFDIIIFVLSVYVLTALTLSMIFNFSNRLTDLLDIIDDVICIVFFADFLRELYLAPNKAHYMKWGWIDLISCIPSFVVFRYGRLFRLVRLLRILRLYRSTSVLIKYIFNSKIKGTMLSVSLIAILLILFSSITILMVENVPASNIKTGSDALWWTMETITSVGYGDKYPVTDWGRVIGSILMVSGTIIFASYTAYIASLFVKNMKKD